MAQNLLAEPVNLLDDSDISEEVDEPIEQPIADVTPIKEPEAQAINLLSEPTNLLGEPEKPKQYESESILTGGREAVVNIATGLGGAAVGGLAGLGTTATNLVGLTDVDPGEVVEDVSGALTVEAESKTGKAIMETIAKPFEWWRETVSKPVGEVAFEPREEINFGPNYIPEIHKPRKVTESPLAATAAFTAAETIPYIFLGKGVKAVSKGVKKGISAVKREHITDPVKAVVEPVKEAFAPIATGSAEAQVAAKTYANNIRKSDTLRNEIIQQLDKKFKKNELKSMGDAAIAEELAASRGIPADKGFNSIPFEHKQVVTDLMNRHKPVADAAIELGILKAHKDSYFPRKVVEMLDSEAKGRISKASGVRLTTSTKHAKKRKYETVEETAAAASEALGKEMKVLNDVRVLPLVTAELEKAIAGKTLINEIKAHSKKLGVDAIAEGKTPGYFHFDHPAMFEWKPRLAKVEGKWAQINDQFGKPIFDRRPIYIHDSFKGPLEAVLKNESGKIANAFMQLKAKSMSMIMFNPLMHGMVIWGKALPFQPYRTLTFRNYAEGRRLMNGSNAEALIKDATSHGLAPIGNQGWMQRMNDIMQTPQLTAGKSWTANVAGKLAKPFGKQEAAMTMVDKAGHFWHDTLLWEPIRHAQFGMYKNLKTDFMKKGMTENAAGQVAAHMSNRFAGSIPYEDMGHGVRATANFMLFSRTFNATNIGIYKDAVKGLPKAVQEQILKTSSKMDLQVANNALKKAGRHTLAKDIAAMYVFNSMLQNAFEYWKTGDAGAIAKEYADNFDRYNKMAEEDPLNYFMELKQLPAQAINEPGKEHRIYMGKDPYGSGTYLRNPVGKIGEDLEKIATSPLAMATDKLSPTMKFIAGVATNDRSINKGYGIDIYNKKGTLKDAPENLGKILMYFMESHTPSGFIESVIDSVSGEDPTGVQVKKVAGQLAGFSVSKGSPGGPAAGFMRETIEKHRKQIREHMPEIIKQLRLGNNDKAQKIMIEDAGMSEADIKRTIRKIYPMFSEKTVQDFLISADKHEQEKLNRMFKKYYGTAGTKQ